MLHDVRVGVEELLGDDQRRRRELALRPERGLVDEHLAAAFFHETCRPGLGDPCAVDLFLEKESQDVGIGQGNHFNRAPFLLEG